MVNESTPFGWQAARKRYSAAERGVKGFRRLSALGFLSLAIALAQAAPVRAQNVGEARDYTISSQPLSTALNQLALAADRQIMVPPELVRGRTAPALAGHYSFDAALRHLLAGSGLTYEITGTGTVVVKQIPPDSPHRRAKPAPAASQRADQKREPTMLQTVVVTGTRIRGGSTPSPVITIGAEQMRQEGMTDLGEVIRNVTENFRGGQNPGVVNGGESSIANQNVGGGSGLNLRGLGADASLTLLNGKRMAYDGFGQAVDISAIPIEAVDRVEIVADGASAIYGSDAVAGVGNVILKRDFEGLTLGTRYGTATEGGLTTREAMATGGTTWSTGGLIATYKRSWADPIYASQRDYTEHLIEPKTIYKKIELESGLLSAHQYLGDSVELRLDAFKTDRDNTSKTGYANYYYYYPKQTKIFLVSPGLEISLPGNWSMSMYATWGKNKIFDNVSQIVKGTGELLSESNSCYCNKSRSYEINAEGPLFPLGDGDARLAIGTGYRVNDFLYRVITGSAHYGGDESSRFAFAELHLPLIGAGSRIPGVRRLELSAAARAEYYSSFSGVTTPKLGMIYGPNENITFKTSWGKSFKAPTLQQQYGIQQAVLYPTSAVGGSGYPADSTALFLGGGNPDLKPERATSWTTSVAFHPQALPSMEAELTWFDINFKGRVVSPIPYVNSPQSLSNPIFDEFINYSPTADEQEKAIAIPKSFNQFYNLTGAVYDPDKVVAIINDLYTNATGQHIRGLDLSGSYRVNLVNGGLAFRGSLSWLDSSQRTTPAQQAYDLSGTLFNPAKLNGRIGAVWTRGGLAASVFANYTGGVMDIVASRKTASFTTFDAVLRYTTQKTAGIWSGMDFALSAQNMFDRTPPLYTTAPLTSPPFDSTNYSAIGRFVSLSVSKHW